jgi:hypothetical protein
LANCISVPFDKGLGLHDHESVAPIKKTRKRNRREPKGWRGPSRFCFPLFEQCELSARKEILGDERST